MHPISNGIYVGGPKVYDDASLEALLRSAQARVAALNGFNQNSLAGHFRAVQDSTADQTQVAAQISGLPKQGATTAAVRRMRPRRRICPLYPAQFFFAPLPRTYSTNRHN